MLSIGIESGYPIPRKQNRAVAARYLSSIWAGDPAHKNGTYTNRCQVVFISPFSWNGNMLFYQTQVKEWR